MTACVAALALTVASACSAPPSASPAPPGAPGAGPSAPAAWVEETLASLSVREAVGQLVVQWIPGGYVSPSAPDFEALDAMVDEGIGGFYLSIGAPHAYAAKVNALQARALSRPGGVPLLFTSDFESGGPAMRLSGQYALPSLLPQGGGTQLPPTMAFGAIGDERFAFEYGRVTAAEALGVGVPLNFAPVLDVNSNPDNPVINTRSFGGDPELVARLGVAFIRGARDAGGFTTAKHFPGHGDTDVDSHLGLPVIERDRDALDRVELVPFRAAIEAGVDAVMSAHVSLPLIVGEGTAAVRRTADPAAGTPAPPATLAPEILTGLLREEMGFDGLVATDALTMAAVADTWGAAEAAVLALEAGADMLLFPTDVAEVIDAVTAAVESGRVSEARVRASARRILAMKADAGLHVRPFVPLDSVVHRVGTGPHLAFADTAASRSITLVRDREGAVPFPGTEGGEQRPTVLSVTFARDDDLPAGRELDREMRRAAERVVSVRLEPESPPEAWARASEALEAVDAVVLGVYLPASAGTGEDVLPPAVRTFARRAAATRPTVLVSLGNPYLLEAFPQVPAYLVAWGGAEVSQRAAARALMGVRPISGRLPIEVPPYAIGHGLDREGGRPAVAPEAPEQGAPPLDPAGRPLEGGDLELTDPRDLAERAARPMTVSLFEARPATVDMDREALEAIDSLLLAAVADSVTPGAALAIGRRGRLVRLRGYGTLDWDGERLASPATIWDLASLTKVVGTTTAVMILDEQGALDLDAPVVRYLPWWSGAHADKELVTVRQLLLHRAGLPAFRRWFFEMEGEDAYRQAVAAEPLEYRPGERTVYSDIGAITLGWIVEAVSGERLDAFLERRVWRPLGMDDTGFLPDPALLGRIAPTEVDTLWRHTHVHGVVHDENADAMGGVAGHAGLFGTAWDLSIFARMMLGSGAVAPGAVAPGAVAPGAVAPGALPPCDVDVRSGVPCTRAMSDSVRILSPETVARYTARHDATSSRALGWDTPEGRSSAGDYFTAEAFGHTGFTGTSIWMDPELDLFVVLLTNRVNPTRAQTGHVALRRAIHDLAARSLTDRRVRPR